MCGFFAYAPEFVCDAGAIHSKQLAYLITGLDELFKLYFNTMMQPEANRDEP